MTEAVLEVQGVTGFLEGASGLRRVLDRVGLRVAAGRSFALLGESGSGKTFLLHSVLGLHPGSPGLVAGEARLLGIDLFQGLGPLVSWEEGPPLRIGKDERAWSRALARRLRGVLGRTVTAVPQDPISALVPFWTVGRMVERAVELGNPALGPGERRERALQWLERVHLYGVTQVARRYPHELSGGMAQRVALALALAPSPRLLAADEPTTGLDATLRVRMIDLLAEAAESSGATLFLITHDTEAARLLARDVAVLLEGRVVEQGPARVVLDRNGAPKHPYTGYLLESERRLLGQGPEGAPPPGDGGPVIQGAPCGPPAEQSCSFAVLCPRAAAACGREVPGLQRVGEEHWIACGRAQR
ncbi:MAG: ABC transporter ATP-binding protein [Thermodesulfobacteriota bacterium]